MLLRDLEELQALLEDSERERKAVQAKYHALGERMEVSQCLHVGCAVIRGERRGRKAKGGNIQCPMPQAMMREQAQMREEMDAELAEAKRIAEASQRDASHIVQETQRETRRRVHTHPSTVFVLPRAVDVPSNV